MERIEIEEPENKLKKFLLDIVDIIAFLVFIIGLFLTIKVFIIAPVVVKGHSMLPNYNQGNYIFIDKFYYKFDGGFKRGDVVVVMPEQSNVSYLKRIIGLPGDTIKIYSGNTYLCKTQELWKQYKNNDIYENNKFTDKNLICKQLKEPYIEGKTVNLKGYPEKIVTTAKCGLDTFTLGSGQYLVFGDDRMYSTDSRCCFRGFCSGKDDIYYITKDEILGKVWGFKF